MVTERASKKIACLIDALNWELLNVAPSEASDIMDAIVAHITKLEKVFGGE